MLNQRFASLKRKKRAILSMAASATLATGIVATDSITNAAQAVSFDNQIHTYEMNLTLLGDSYTAGNGAGDYYSRGYRSYNNWGHQYANKLAANNIYADVVNLAHSGDTTQEVLDFQVPFIPSNTDLVMMTIGGNDVNFKDIVSTCFVFASYSCESRVNEARALLPEVKERTYNTFKAIQEKVRPGVKLVLVSYPLLSTDDEYKFGSFDAGRELRAFGWEANAVQQDLVNRWNSENPAMPVEYVNDIEYLFAGHEPHPYTKLVNRNRWINELYEMNGRYAEDGSITSDTTADFNNWYHPNRIGHERIAQHLFEKYPSPESKRPVDRTVYSSSEQVQAAKLPEILNTLDRSDAYRKSQIGQLHIGLFDMNIGINFFG